MKHPELLAPAGSPEALRAAVENGADAVYLGWGDFNARRSAKNFSDEEFRDALRYCHIRGVRVFLTLNTLLTDRELPLALETAAKAAEWGVDAVLVQDWGLFDLMRQSLPDLPLHASTQMSIFTLGGARELAEDGCERIVIARECSQRDTKQIINYTPAEIEIFVHGALCMCYSGQCAMSALIGGRSGNRGRCAQPCRLPYRVDGQAGKNEYPLSLKDSCLAPHIPAMTIPKVPGFDSTTMCISCLKLEGRMKRPEYVAVITRIYAKLLDERRAPTPEEQQELEEAFSRSGFTDGYWTEHRGKEMFGTRPENTPEPKELFAAARASYEKPQRTVHVDMTCTIAEGQPSELTISDPQDHVCTVYGPVPEPALTHELTDEDVEMRLRKTGNAPPYRCTTSYAEVDPGLFLSAGAINDLRRRALDALTEARTAMPERRRLAPPPLPKISCHAKTPEFTVSVQRLDQLSPELLALSPARIYAPVELLATLKKLPAYSGEWCAVLPRVWRDGNELELQVFVSLCNRLGVTGVALSNLGHFSLMRDSGIPMKLYGDFGLNVFNAHSLNYLRAKGLESTCLSFELRMAQIRDMPKLLPTEAIVYGRLPLMITENCLVQNCYGCEKTKKNSVLPGSPCGAGHTLVDRTGAAFPITGVYGHRSELQNSRPVWLADRPDYRQAGLAYARLRFTTETAQECVDILRAYQEGRPATGEFTRGLYERGVE